MAIKFFRSDIIAAILAVAFLAAVFFFLESYTHYLDVQEKIASKTVRLRLMADQKKEIDSKRRTVRMANDFIAKSVAYGLEKNRWATHEVSIEQPVYFSDLEQIVSQCTSTSSYYFRPLSLQVKTGSGFEDETREESGGFKPAQSPEMQEGEMLLTLKGQFIVGPR